MKIISIGTNHAGTSFVRTLAKINKNVEITTYDKNSNISFLSCGIALWVGDEFKDPKGLFYSSKEELEKLGVNVKTEHEVIEINTDEKYVTVKNLKTNEEFKDNYDKLVYSAGAWPIVPPFPGVNLENIFLSKIYQHAQKIKEISSKEEIKNIVVIGAGYIGIELVEAFVKKGKKVTLIDLEKRVVPRYFDTEFTKPLENKMKDLGVNLQFGEKVERFEGKNKVEKVITDQGEYDADMVILSIGTRPQTQLLKGKVDMLPNGSIIVDNKMQTNINEIYVIGDSAAIKHNVLGSMGIQLATNAIKTGIVAAMNINNNNIEFPGVQGTNGIDVFGFHYASTGISEEFARRANMDVGVEILLDKDRPEFMKNAEDVQIKIIYDKNTLELLGAQIGSWGNAHHTEAIYCLSLAIQKNMKLPEIALMDFYFLPHHNKPFNYILKCVLNALNIKY